MSEPIFTPGPWEWSTSNSWRRLSAGGKDGNVMYPCVDRHDRHPNLEFPNGGFEGPDARLIATAPEMYEALREAKEFIENQQLPDAEWSRILDTIVAVLAKAVK